MPETYNFTARATAANGASADRDFSITVKNTQLHRLMLAGSYVCLRALDAESPWETVPNVQGTSVAYGDRWIVYSRGGVDIYVSKDAINWEKITISLPKAKPPLLGYAWPEEYSLGGHLCWRGGAWWATFYRAGKRDDQNYPNIYEAGIGTSVDGGKTWTLVGEAAPAEYWGGGFCLSFERSESGASLFGSGVGYFFRPDDNSKWFKISNPSAGSIHQIAYLNGVWFAPYNESNPAKAPVLAHSLDGVRWVHQSNAATFTGCSSYGGAAWGNGYLLAYPRAYSDIFFHDQKKLAFSLDAGTTLQQSPDLPAALAAFSAERPIVFQGGRFVCIGGSVSNKINCTLWGKTPDGPWKLNKFPNEITMGYNMFPPSLAVRP